MYIRRGLWCFLIVSFPRVDTAVSKPAQQHDVVPSFAVSGYAEVSDDEIDDVNEGCEQEYTYRDSDESDYQTIAISSADNSATSATIGFGWRDVTADDLKKRQKLSTAKKKTRAPLSTRT